MSNVNWIIAAILMPVPVLHLWLHALLPWWRKRPELFKIWGLLLYVGSFLLFPHIDRISPVLFFPSPTTQLLGAVFIIIGAFLVIWSVITLGYRRFFMWAVLRPGSVSGGRVWAGLYRFLPHPAYSGYILMAVGNLLTSGKLYTAGVLVFLIVFLPIVIWLEEAEMRERFK